MLERIQNPEIWGKIAGISFAASLIITISIITKDKLKKKKTIQLTFSDIATEFVIVYIASMVSYAIVYIGFGIK
uniref:Uncharacterized protein n=1 Tax=viral metagenome TaxID=1070528 RepID=A0A6C0JML4_9ZZZZ